MKKNILKSILFGLTMAIGLVFTSCDKDETDAPTLNFIAEVDGYVVTITAEATDANTWEWNYDDGTTAATAESHTYTYAESGTYTITCTVKGDGGEATKSVDVTIAGSIEELISGGPSATNGKTWVVNTVATTGKNGAGMVDNDLTIHPDMALVPDNMLTLFGLEDEYDNEYTFYSDGTYVMNPVNGQIVAGLIHGIATQTIVTPSNTPGLLPFCAATYTTPENGTWALSTDDYTMNAIMDPSFDENAEPYEVTFTFPTDNKTAKFDLSEGQFLGVYDAFVGEQAPVTILKEITAEKMHIIVLVSGDENHPYLPTLAFHITLVPKN
jgi:PKD repeat protein